MKNVVLILLLLVVVAGAYVYFLEPELLERFSTSETTESADAPVGPIGQPDQPRDRVEPSKPKPVKKTKPGTLTVTADNLAIYVNGKTVQAGEVIELQPGPVVISGYGVGGFGHQVLDLAEGAEERVRLQTQPAKAAKDWTTYQGDPLRTGHVAIADRTELNQQWKASLGDKVRSSPIILGDIAYFSSESALLTAVSLNDGSVVWRHGELGSSVSPVANQTHIFVGDDIGRLGGYRLRDGKLRGEENLGSYPVSFALINEEAFLAVTRANELISIETRKRGLGSRLPLKVIWRVELPQLAGSTATPVIAGNRAIFATDAGSLFAVNLNDGSPAWGGDEGGEQGMRGNVEMSFADADFFKTPTPAADSGQVYAVLDGALTATALSNGKQTWSQKLGYRATSSISLANGLLYIGAADGTVRVHSVTDGAAALTVRGGSGPIFAAPILFRDKLLVADGEGMLRLHHAFTGEVLDTEKGLWGAAIDGTPAVTEQGILAVNRKGDMVSLK